MSEQPAVRVEQHLITTRDKITLSATLYRPETHSDYTVLIAGAMGMPQRFYRHYAQWLAEQGCVVLTFDYRSIAASRQNGRSLWGDRTTLMDWATHDLQAALMWLTRQYPSMKLTVVGHSVGGHLLGGAAQSKDVYALMGVGAQNIYWRHWAWWQQPMMGLFWFVLLPLLSHALGFFPAGWFGLGEALPKQVALQWKDAASNYSGTRGLFLGTQHDYFDAVTGHARYYSFADDAFAPKKAVDDILTFYPNTQTKQRRHIAPDDIGVERIGHNRFFLPTMRETLWRESHAWMLDPASDTQIATSADEPENEIDVSKIPVPPVMQG